MKALFFLVILVSSVANASMPYFKCQDGTVLTSDGKVKGDAWFRFRPRSDVRYYMIESGAGTEGGYSVGDFESFERPNELVQLVATGYAEDTINGRPIRSYEVTALAGRAEIGGIWLVRRTVRVTTSSSERTIVDVFSFEPQNCSWQ